MESHHPAQSSASELDGQAPRLRVVPIPRVDGSTLSFSTFYRKFALPGLPVILTGLGSDWVARTKWSTLQGLLARGLDLDEVVQVQVDGQRIVTMTVGQVFQTLAERDVSTSSLSGSAGGRVADGVRPRKRGRPNAPCVNESTGGVATQPSGKLYLRNWRFHERNPQLLLDYAVPTLFSLDFAEEAGLVAPNSFTWLYIGEAGSSTPTHVDVMNTSAWMYVLSGRKRWRMVTSDGLERCFCASDGGREGQGNHVHVPRSSQSGSLIDLFSPDEELRTVLGSGITVYEDVIGPGEIMFTPSKSAHAVENLHGDLSIALTSNYVDLTNVMDVYDSLSGVHPNGNPLPPFHPCVEELLAVCVPRAMSMLADKCDPAEAVQLQRLLRQILQSACERRADLLAQRRKVISQLAKQLGCGCSDGMLRA